MPQHETSVQAGIPIGLDLVRGRANDKKGHADNIVDEMIAHIGNIFFATGHLPYTSPYVLDLSLEELARRVAVNRNPIGAVHIACIQSKDGGDFGRILVEKLLVGDPFGCRHDDVSLPLTTVSRGRSLVFAAMPAGS